MHPNPSFRWNDPDAMLAFVAEHPFAQLFVAAPAGLRVAQVPVQPTGEGRLRFHLARSNEAAAGLDGSRALLTVMGPHGYVSPDWYGTPDQVPTWNYLTVEVEGLVRRLPDADLPVLLDALSQANEARLAPKPAWTRDKMAPGRFEAMLRAIAPFELEPAAIRGTRKLGQNKRPDERAGAAAGVRAAGNAPLARLMDPDGA